MNAAGQTAATATHAPPEVPSCVVAGGAGAGGEVYIGSPEHKGRLVRSAATPCPVSMELPADQFTPWLREAIRGGPVGGPLEGGFPRHVWHREKDWIFEARLTNREQGHYKGYPITPKEAERIFRL